MTFVPATPHLTLLSVDDRIVALEPPSTTTTAAAPHPRTLWPLPSTGEMAAVREQIDRHLKGYLVKQRAEYLRQPIFSTLYDDLTEFVSRKGKRLRSLLFLLANRIFQTTDESISLYEMDPGLLSVGVSLELLHGFILVHDDIIDRSETRRGLPTLHRVIESRLSTFSDRGRTGRNLALVLGDVLFALAQKCLLEAALPPGANTRLGSLLLDGMVETGFGEAADIIHGTRDVAKVSPAEIEQMYRLKTTCYTIGCPLTMAAALNGVDAAGLDALCRISQPAGLAFQIQNDLQEFSRFEVSDVEVPADILEGKKTLLMRAAFDSLNETDRGLLQLCFSSGAPTEATVSKARELMTKSGAVAGLSKRMNELFQNADQEILRSPFAPAVREGLSGLIHLVRSISSVA